MVPVELRKIDVFRSFSSSEPTFRGRVRINCNNFVKHWSCYLSKTLNKDGSISLTSSVDDALEVGFGPAPDGSQCLLIPNVQYRLLIVILPVY